jgi:hypothetical protein
MEGDVRAWYNPANLLGDFEIHAGVDTPEMIALQQPVRENEVAMVSCSDLPPGVIKELDRIDHWRSLNNEKDFKRIHVALSQEINKQKKKREYLGILCKILKQCAYWNALPPFWLL